MLIMLEGIYGALGSAITGMAVSDYVIEVGRFALWLQTLGVIVLLWLIFQLIILIINYRRQKAIYKMQKDIERLEEKMDSKLDKLLEKKR